MTGLMQMLGAGTLAQHSIFKAPPEARYSELSQLIADAAAQRKVSTQRDVKQHDWLFLAPDKVGIGNQNYFLSHTSFRQVCNFARVRLGDLRRVTEETAKRMLNELWPRKDAMLRILYETDAEGMHFLRAINSVRYERLWDIEVLSEIQASLIPSGFVPAAPTLPGHGDSKALVRDDSNMFVSFIKNQTAHGTDDFGGIRRGIMVYNGETGERSFGYVHFLFREISNTMIFWGADEFGGGSHRHLKNVRRTFADFREFAAKYESDLLDVEFDKLAKSRETDFAPLEPGSPFTPEQEAQSKLIREYGLDEDVAAHIVTLALDPVHGDSSLSVWAFANALTAHGKDLPDAGSRIEWAERGAAVLASIP